MILPFAHAESAQAVYGRLVGRLAHVRSVRFEMAGEGTVAPRKVRLDRSRRRETSADAAPPGWEAFFGQRKDVVPHGTARWFAPWVEIDVVVHGQTVIVRLDPRTGLPAEYQNPSVPDTYVYRKVRLVRLPLPKRRR